MRLAGFIHNNIPEIAAEWEALAASLVPDKQAEAVTQQSDGKSEL